MTSSVRAPVRVNLIGEHTDYDDGYALAVVLDLEVQIELTSRGGDDVRLTTVQRDR